VLVVLQERAERCFTAELETLAAEYEAGGHLRKLKPSAREEMLFPAFHAMMERLFPGCPIREATRMYTEGLELSHIHGDPTLRHYGMNKRGWAQLSHNYGLFHIQVHHVPTVGPPSAMSNRI
jgi:hypothetical protein